jgi:CHASE3 domain sensor protein
MNPRLIRVLIVVIGIAIVSAASYFLNGLNRQITSERSSTDNLRDQASALTATIGNVRAGQFAYVARGQNEDFWMSHVASLMPSLEKQSDDFAAALTAPAAKTAFEPAAAALDNLKALDGRVKEFVRNGTALLAADMIFSDGLESTSTAATQVMTALNEEIRVRNGSAGRLQQRQMAIAGAAAASVLLLLVALAFTSTPEQRLAEPEPTPAPPIDPMRVDYPVARAKPALTPKLVTTAQICGELARVGDEEQLPVLLLRSAKVLDAAGIIVWVPEPSGQSLRPVLSHGYEDKVITRLGRIHRDANNAVANAFRSEETRTVAGDASTNGAVIVPLMTSDGCVGVLSAEMKGGSEKDEGSQALAAIFAAQLATLVATPAPSTSATQPETVVPGSDTNATEAPPMRAVAQG